MSNIDYHNRPTTMLYTLEDVQEYEAEVARARVENREPELTDPRLRTHATEVATPVEENEQPQLPLGEHLELCVEDACAEGCPVGLTPPTPPGEDEEVTE